ncbi:dihydroneopterin aldolase [Piscinibacter sp. XHJ-5]|uniref:dihydroneopterin aldolase n=1 Tax=Piscinibacter sp. XHJ-5 TaxID=3037797 RepID=UPI002452C9D0|nr:dihydroneopterin aldolase [Piscinibacter sp. XHJ-5]
MTNAPVLASVHEAAPVAAAEPLDLIFIEGFVGQTVIGIHDSELHKPQPVAIDVCAGVPRPRACDTDCIADTIDYGELRTRLQRLMVEHGVQLLEALAEQVAQIALYEFHAHWVRVRVSKPHKFDDAAAVGVMIERRRTPHLDAGHRAASTLRLIGAGLVPGGR